MKILSFLLAVLLSGYAAGRQDAPVGDEWQSPQQLALNKDVPHAWFFSFPDVESAARCCRNAAPTGGAWTGTAPNGGKNRPLGAKSA